MRVAEDRARWREIGEVYVQQWTGSGLMMMIIIIMMDKIKVESQLEKLDNFVQPEVLFTVHTGQQTSNDQKGKSPSVNPRRESMYPIDHVRVSSPQCFKCLFYTPKTAHRPATRPRSPPLK
jgi:hypothetical protein